MERRARPWELADPNAELRILLCHFPDVVDRIPAGSFDLVLAGHLHGGQICLPFPGGKLRLSSIGPPYPEGVFRLGTTTLVVSRGVGTTFVPFRFFSRPQAAALVLRAAR
jgi:predicted MPP superfamily phosphohydrolase